MTVVPTGNYKKKTVTSLTVKDVTKYEPMIYGPTSWTHGLPLAVDHR